MQDTAVLLEEFVEVLSQAAAVSASKLASSAVQSPKEGFAVLQQLKQGLSEDALLRYEVHNNSPDLHLYSDSILRGWCIYDDVLLEPVLNRVKAIKPHAQG